MNKLEKKLAQINVELHERYKDVDKPKECIDNLVMVLKDKICCFKSILQINGVYCDESLKIAKTKCDKDCKYIIKVGDKNNYCFNQAIIYDKLRK